MQMMNIKSVRWVVVALALTLFSLPHVASAKESAQVGQECTMVPLELPLFGGTPVAEVESPEVSGTPPTERVSERAIEDALELYVACTNTGDPTLIWAMFSPRWFSATFADPEQHYLPAFELMLDNDQGTSDQLLHLVEIEEITQRPDGKVDVRATFRSADEEWTDTLALVLVDGQWLIDDVRLDTPTS